MRSMKPWESIPGVLFTLLTYMYIDHMICMCINLKRNTTDIHTRMDNLEARMDSLETEYEESEEERG